MVREQQQPVTRDFLGLGNIASSAPGEDCAQFEAKVEEGKHDNSYFGAFHGWPGDKHKGFGAVNIPAGGIPSNSNMAFTGVKHPVWNKGVTMQQFFALRNSLEERYLADSHGLAHTRQWQVPLPGTVPRIGGVPGGTRSRMHASDVCAKQCGAQLTILYAGNVNVYDDISADKAQEIMHLAANGNSWPTNVLNAPLGASHALAAQGSQQPGNAENFHFNVQIGQTQFAADQASQSSPPSNKQLEYSTPGTPSSASSSPPAVPRALPLARKASLARFLEKRKERVQMMSPYLMKKISPEQSIFPGSNYGATFSMAYDEYVKKTSIDDVRY